MLNAAALKGYPMARWTLRCKNCGQLFTHSKISDTLADYFVPEKPKFPPGGLECECSNCKSKFTYEQNELRYEG